jgi:hypothetical protein
MQIQQTQVQYTVDAILSVVSAFFDNPSLFVSDVRFLLKGGGTRGSHFTAGISLAVEDPRARCCLSLFPCFTAVADAVISAIVVVG